MKINSIRELLEIDTRYKNLGFENIKPYTTLDFIKYLKERGLNISKLDLDIDVNYDKELNQEYITFTFYKDNQILYKLTWSTIGYE